MEVADPVKDLLRRAGGTRGPDEELDPGQPVSSSEWVTGCEPDVSTPYFCSLISVGVSWI